MKGNKLWKIFSTAIVLVFVVTSVYLMVGSASSKSILKSYNAVKPDSSSGFSKTLLFLQSYTQATGDTSLAIKKGMSEEDAKEIANGGTVVDPGDGSTSCGATTAAGRTKADIEAALAQRAAGEGDAGEYYTTSSGAWKITEVNGSSYLVEVQGAKWAAVYNGKNKKGNSVYVKDNGCWMFACSSAINAVNMSTVSIADIMPEFRASNTSISYDKNSHAWTGKATWDGHGTDAQDKPIFTKYGLNYNTLKNKENMTGEQARQIMSSEGFNNCVYIIYGHVKGVITSSGGQGDHWLVCVGTTDNSLYLLNNGNRDVEIPVSKIANSGAINTIIKISK